MMSYFQFLFVFLKFKENLQKNDQVTIEKNFLSV